jgi:hypothetical protein
MIRNKIAESKGTSVSEVDDYALKNSIKFIYFNILEQESQSCDELKFGKIDKTSNWGGGG